MIIIQIAILAYLYFEDKKPANDGVMNISISDILDSTNISARAFQEDVSDEIEGNKDNR